MNAHCPVCVDAPLNPKVRDGVEIDVCSSCRGIWLDRGELEKLITRAQEELGNYSRDSEPPSSRRGYAKRHPPRKRRLAELLGDLFD